LILTVIAVVAAVVVAVLALTPGDADKKADSPLAGPSPEEVVRIFLRATETGDLATAKKVTCEADIGGRTSIDSPWGGEISMTVAGKHFEVRGRTVVPLTANGKAPAGLGGAEQHNDDGGVAPLIRDKGGWKVCFKDFYTDISGSESRSQPTNSGGVSWV